MINLEDVENFLKNEFFKNKKIDEKKFFEIIKVFPKNNFINCLTKIYLCKMEFEEIKNSFLNKYINIKSKIELSPEFFYFTDNINFEDFENYYKNLVKFNEILVIDDIIYKIVNYLDSNICRHLFYVLKNRKFIRSTLRYIFDNILYFEDESYYKYGVLNYIINYYAISDQNNENTNDDNVMVLSNLVWEDFFRIFEYNLMLPGDNSKSKLENVYILELFNTIVENTGGFFYNRINQNLKIFEKVKELSVVKKLINNVKIKYEKGLHK